MSLSHTHVRFLLACVACVMSLALNLQALPAEVSAQISSREMYVGVPVTLSIQVVNAESYQEPVFAEIEGLRIRSLGSAQTSSFTSIINGVKTERTTETVTYSIVAVHPGTFTIPATALRADGRDHMLPSFIVHANPLSRSAVIDRDADSDDPADTVFLEVLTDVSTGYQGQAVQCTLNIFVQPYEDREARILLDAEDMIDFIDFRRSQLGVFGAWGDSLRAQKVTREDTRGNVATYIQYTLDGRVWLDDLGTFTIDPVTIQMEYPLVVFRVRSLIQERYNARRRQPLVIGTDAHHIDVKPLPEPGRPEHFTGAVGRYDVAVSAAPTDVTVGEPITLVIDIIDETPGGGRLELIRSPPLATIESFASSFRVPSDELAGRVDGDTKTFEATVRATSDHVNAIPPVPFSFFDPNEQRYVTVQSEPIRIRVESTGRVTLSDVIAAEGSAEQDATTLTERAGIVANYTGESLLLANHDLRLGWQVWILLGAPPALLLVSALHQARTRRLKNDSGLARRRGARGRAAARLNAAGHLPQPQQAGEIAAAVAAFACDRLNLPQGSTRPEIRDHMARAGLTLSTIDQFNDLLETCEQQMFAGDSANGNDGLIPRARTCIRQLERIT